MKIFYIDVGVEHTHIREKKSVQGDDFDIVIKNESESRSLLERSGVWPRLQIDASGAEPQIMVTGKLAVSFIKAVGRGKKVAVAAAYWSAAQKLIQNPENADYRSLGIIDLSASGYLALSVDCQGELIKDNLAQSSLWRRFRYEFVTRLAEAGYSSRAGRCCPVGIFRGGWLRKTASRFGSS